MSHASKGVIAGEPPIRAQFPAKLEAGGRLESIQILRGIAASMVVLAHAASGTDFAAAFPILGKLNSYGYLGVPIFFAISGFVIPHMMASMNYRIGRDAWPFFLRRLIRLEPPYAVTVICAFAIAYAAARTPGYGGPPFTPTLGSFLLQFLYVGPWFGIPWIDNVTWTLAIEFQYYILMLFAAPLLLSDSVWRRVIFLAVVIALSLLVRDDRAIFLYLPCFAIGFVVFLFYHRQLGMTVLAGLCVLFAGLAAYNSGIFFAIAALIGGALILMPLRQPLPLLSALGAISYSLYLVHLPVGGRVGNLLMRIPEGWNQTAAAVGAIGASLLAAVVLWYFVERPAHLWARKTAVH
jgi:peptidoglycan/LPS O-acetylase OafA/YrhL